MRAAVVAVILLLAGCLGTSPSPPTPTGGPAIADAAPPEGLSARRAPIVTVAIIDTGSNPYHSEFAERFRTEDPAAYIPGYPAGVPVIRLSPDGPVTGQGAISSLRGQNRAAADEAMWSGLKPFTLHRIEGTKIVGIFGGDMPGSGHGTMTTGRAAGNTISAAGPEVRLVFTGWFGAQEMRWIAEQRWIDLVSISGASIFNEVPVVSHELPNEDRDALRALARLKPVFVSAGNAGTTEGTATEPAWIHGEYGLPEIVSVGGNDNGHLIRGANMDPYIVGDYCSNPAVPDNEREGIKNSGGGTSSASPYSAGVAAALLLHARKLLSGAIVPGAQLAGPWALGDLPWTPGADAVVLAEGDASARGITAGPLADGRLTMPEFKEVLFRTAIADGGVDASDGDACPSRHLPNEEAIDAQTRARLQGYGEVNLRSLDVAKRVLEGSAALAPRPIEDEAYRRNFAIRSQLAD